MNTTFRTSMEALSPKNIPHSSVENKPEMLLSSSSSPPPPPVSSPPSQPIKNEKKTPTTHQFIPPPQTNSPPSSEGAPVSPPLPPQPTLPIKCPRCDSPDTKFCYYNNYSHTQPRHYCRTCHRYWTKGGALRNIPFGGSSKKRRSRSVAASLELLTGEDSNGPKPFQGTLSPMSFRLETTLSHFPNPKIPSPNLSPFGDHPSLNPPMGGPYILESSLNSGKVTDHSYLRCGTTSSNLSLIGRADHSLGGKNAIISPASNISGGGGGDGGSSSRSLAPPMESLSSLHWKLLQHQRMAMLYGGGDLGINRNGYLKEEPEMLSLTPAEEEKSPQLTLFRNIMEVKSGQKLENDHDLYNHHGSATAGNEVRGKEVDTSGWLFGGGNHGGGDDEDNDGNKCIVNSNSKKGSSGGGGQGWPPDQLRQHFNGST